MELDYADGATPLGDEESLGLIPTHISTVADLNEWEQTNILRAESWAFRRKRSILTDTFARELHRRMFSDTWRWAGKYRTSDKNIGVPWYTIAAAVRDTCANASAWLDGRIFELDVIGVRLHHRMVSVHPFPNGNGRHARLLADLLVHQHDVPRFTWGRADLQIAGSARGLYLEALRSADDGEFGPLLEFARS